MYICISLTNPSHHILSNCIFFFLNIQNMSTLQRFLCLLFLLPSLVLGDCTCESDNEERDKRQALQYKLAAVASILVAGAIGVCIWISLKF
jgi:hypothetical protein